MIAGFAALAAWLGWQAWAESQRAPAADAPTVEFLVEGLDCPFWCAVKLTDAIDSLDGASVEGFTPAEGRITIRHDPERQSIAALQTVFEARGFPVLATNAGGR